MKSERPNSIDQQEQKMKQDEYPALFQSGDLASLKAQRTYHRMQRLYLGSLVISSLISAITGLGGNVSVTWSYSVIAILLAIGLLILWVTRAQQYDKAWFDCRAVAESVKTITWRYMMKIPPFLDESVDSKFIAELQDIRNAIPGFEKYIAGKLDTTLSQISEYMRLVRSQSLDDRKSFYLSARLKDQKAWYSNKANYNARAGSKWFWIVLVLQFLAIVFAILKASIDKLPINIVPVATTCAAIVVAWNQIKRHDELKKTYSLAAMELGELESISINIKTNDDFIQFVEQIEETISREHTMWCARRDVKLPEHERSKAK